jgi:hypothetical protein
MLKKHGLLDRLAAAKSAARDARAKDTTTK